jgi:hypothetical protein
MTPEVSKLLAIADQDWEFGFMKKARAGYDAVLARDPSNWHAAFQLAWIDSGFGQIDADRVEHLRGQRLPSAAAERVERLSERIQRGPFLDGNVSTWDIEALRQLAEAKTARWWEDRGARAAAAAQYGLALACYGEAEQLTPEMYFDPPAAFKAVPRPGNHLHALRTADNLDNE